MKGIINSFKWIIKFFKIIFGIITHIFQAIGYAFNYILSIVALVSRIILTLPSWLLGFATITLSIAIVYFIIGRESGKSE